MLKVVALLTPVFISLFWAVILHGDRKTHSVPRSFLAKFMILLFILFLVKFFYFEPLPNIYPYFDLIHIYAGVLVFPVYHIYFRLLTVDERFSWKAHAWHLILPSLLVLAYGVGVLLTPSIEYRTMLFNKLAFPDSPQVHFLHVMHSIINYSVQVQVIVYVILNTRLIRKYGDRAEQFYSDINDGKYNNANMLNYMIIINAVVTIICYMIFLRHAGMVYIFPTLYAVVAYLIGYMGYKQKAVNPTFDLTVNKQPTIATATDLSASQKKILGRLLTEFDEKKIYLNSQLNILHIVQAVGTNRTTISSLINQQYNQNFCSFVNGFRMQELERVYAENPEYTNDTLAECCGFGSVSSLKRSVYSKTGLSITEWKNQYSSKQQVG